MPSKGLASGETIIEKVVFAPTDCQPLSLNKKDNNVL